MICWPSSENWVGPDIICYFSTELCRLIIAANTPHVWNNYERKLGGYFFFNKSHIFFKVQITLIQKKIYAKRIRDLKMHEKIACPMKNTSNIILSGNRGIQIMFFLREAVCIKKSQNCGPFPKKTRMLPFLGEPILFIRNS